MQNYLSVKTMYRAVSGANKAIATPENTLNVHDRIVTRYESTVGLSATKLQF